MRHGEIARRGLGGTVGMGMVVADNTLLPAAGRTQEVELRLGIDGKSRFRVFGNIGSRHDGGDNNVMLALT